MLLSDTCRRAKSIFSFNMQWSTSTKQHEVWMLKWGSTAGVFSILILSPVWGTAVSSGLTPSLCVSLKSKRLRKDDRTGQVCMLRWVCPPHSLPLLVCPNMKRIHTGKGTSSVGWRVGRRQRGQEQTRLMTERGGNSEMEARLQMNSRVKQHLRLLPPSSSCNYIIIMLLSHPENITMQPLNTTFACSFILPQVFTTGSISSIRLMQRSTCLYSAGSAEAHRYTNNTREAVWGIAAHFITKKEKKKHPQG